MTQKGSLFLIVLSMLMKFSSPESTFESPPSYAVAGPKASNVANLFCVFKDVVTDAESLYYSWVAKNGGTLLAFGETNMDKRMSSKMIIDNGTKKVVLTVDPVLIADQGQYHCQLSSDNLRIKATVNLTVNQLPATSVTRLKSHVLEGEEATVAVCHANLSKPAPEMWFEDSQGRLATGDVMTSHECGNGLVNSSLYLTKTFVRGDQNEVYYCKMRHVNRTTEYSIPLGTVDVRYSPSVTLQERSLEKKTTSLPGGIPFAAACLPVGNPTPSVTWTFTPDVVPNTTDDARYVQTSFDLPKNFQVDGNRMYTKALQSGKDKKEINNGTFTCIATNVVEPAASVSFHLQVFDLPPTTTPPTTTEAATLEDNVDNNTANRVAVAEPTAKPRVAGPNAAVIAGVVAVAVFVLIVAIILLLRYFMAHRGEYYTNELRDGLDKSSIDEDDGDDDALPKTDTDLLGEKKRTEHFL